MSWKYGYATVEALDSMLMKDTEIDKTTLLKKLFNNEIMMAIDTNGNPIGYLRYSLFWDEVPHLNMIVLDEAFRQLGAGKGLLLFWEAEMKRMGYNLLITTAAHNRVEQHFFRKMGYQDSGSFLFASLPLQIIFSKSV